jgi:cobalt-zinc-cadmium efflux system outer membrane protein
VPRTRIRIPAATLALLLAGCSSLPADHGRKDVAGLVAARGTPLPEEAAGAKLIAELAGKPLTADSAVRIALVNNPRLKAEYARLGIASAEVYDAGRLSNPTLSAAWLDSDETGAADQVTYGLTQSFTDLLLLRSRTRLARGEFARAQQSVGREIQNLAADTEAAYYRLVGAKQVAAMRAAIANAATVSAQLAQRFSDAGNINRLELAQAQAAASESELKRLEAEASLAEARAELNMLLGFTDGQVQWEVENRLPMPVAQEDELASLQSLAERNRLDLAAARMEVDLLADSLGVMRRTRWLGGAEVGVETERDPDRSRLTGPTLALELPLFNRGKGRVARAESLLAQAEADLQIRQIEAGNAVQLAHAGLLNARARAELYRSALIPQREAIVQHSFEEVNYMLRGQFELLFAKQQEYDAWQGYLEAVRDYWLARVELARQVGTHLPSDAQIGGKTLDIETRIAPAPTPAAPADGGTEPQHRH